VAKTLTDAVAFTNSQPRHGAISGHLGIGNPPLGRDECAFCVKLVPDALFPSAVDPGAPSSEVVAEAGKVRPDIKVLLTSAYSQEMIADAMNAPQIRGFIRKPFQLGDLVQKLKNTLVMG
jgi:DNA-binding NarL/FixJ family response regulator